MNARRTTESTAIRIVHLDPCVLIKPAASSVPNETDAASEYIMAAGVLFFSVSSAGTVYYLIGKEQYHQHWSDSEKWADFGGGVDQADEDITSTAAREAWEESMGCIQTYEVLLSRLRNNEAVAVFDIQAADNAGCYRIYILRIPYMDYHGPLSRFRSYLLRHKIQILDAEKTALEWVEAKQLIDTAVSGDQCLRPNFAKSIVEISQVIDMTFYERETGIRLAAPETSKETAGHCVQ